MARSRPTFQRFVRGRIEQMRLPWFDRDANLIAGRDPRFLRGAHDEFNIAHLNVDMLLGAEWRDEHRLPAQVSGPNRPDLGVLRAQPEHDLAPALPARTLRVEVHTEFA